MFLVYQIDETVYAKNLDTVQMFAVQQTQIIDYYQSTVFGSYDNNQEAVARFNDVIDAAAADKQVYDLREKVGYWKPKKAGRKPAAEKSPPEHHTPAPKK